MASRVPKINENPRRINGLFYLKKAKKAYLDNNYAEAYEYFVHYFESLNDPSEATAVVQTVFTKLVCKIGTVLEETYNTEELLKCYIQTINLFPNNYIILNNLGAYMFRIGQVDIARKYLEQAVRVNKDYLPAEKNLLYVMWDQIPRWHFRMLNNKERNIAYDKAVTSTLLKGYKNVVDIGAGCGLLSLIASRDPEARVYAYEDNKPLYRMCSDILRENNSSNVKLINCHSTEVKDPPDKCDLIITEIFDVALFGERALETLLHALTVLVTKDDFKIIPCGATVYVTGIYGEELLSKNQVINETFLKILNLEGLCITQNESEPYDGEHLSNKNVQYMTSTEEIFNINFQNLEQISRFVHDENFEQTVHLRCKKGDIHALAVWFDLNLTDGISITTNPQSDSCSKCWEQAIFYLDHTIHAEEGEILTLKVTVDDCKLSFNITDKHDTHECFKVSKDMVTFLNDEKLIESIINIAQKFEDASLSVIDYNVFPLLGFLLAKNKDCQVYHPLKNNCDTDRYFFQYVLSKNNIPVDEFTFLNEEIRLGVNIGKKQSLYFFDCLCPDGSLESSYMRRKNEIISTINIPQVIKVNVQLIYSWYLDHCNRVQDDNVFNFKIAKYMNEYTGYEHPNLDEFDYQEYTDTISFVLEGDGKISSPVGINKDGIINSILCWFDLELYENIHFSTLTSSHYKKSCFLLDSSKKVSAGDTLRVVLHSDSSYIKIYLQ